MLSGVGLEQCCVRSDPLLLGTSLAGAHFVAEPDLPLVSGCLLLVAEFPAPLAPPSSLQGNLVSARTYFWPFSFLLVGL